MNDKEELEEWCVIHEYQYLCMQLYYHSIDIQLGELMDCFPSNSILPKIFYQSVAKNAYKDEHKKMLVSAMRIDMALSTLDKKVEITEEKLLSIKMMLPINMQKTFQANITNYGTKSALNFLKMTLEDQKPKLERYAKNLAHEIALVKIKAINENYSNENTKQCNKGNIYYFFSQEPWLEIAEKLRDEAFIELKSELRLLKKFEDKMMLCESAMKLPVFCNPHGYFNDKTLIKEIDTIINDLKEEMHNISLFQSSL